MNTLLYSWLSWNAVRVFSLVTVLVVERMWNQRGLRASSGSEGKLHPHASGLGMNWQYWQVREEVVRSAREEECHLFQPPSAVSLRPQSQNSLKKLCLRHCPSFIIKWQWQVPGRLAESRKTILCHLHPFADCDKADWFQQGCKNGGLAL